MANFRNVPPLNDAVPPPNGRPQTMRTPVLRDAIPVGEATEFPKIPVGQASPMIPVGEATEFPKIPVGQVTEGISPPNTPGERLSLGRTPTAGIPGLGVSEEWNLARAANPNAGYTPNFTRPGDPSTARDMTVSNAPQEPQMSSARGLRTVPQPPNWTSGGAPGNVVGDGPAYRGASAATATDVAPNVKGAGGWTPGSSPQAQAWRSSLGGADAAPQATAGILDKARSVGNMVRGALSNPIVQTGMRGMAGAGAVLSAADAGADAANGNYQGMAGHVGDTLAGGAAALGGPLTAAAGGAWLAGRGIRNIVDGRRDAAQMRDVASGIPSNPLGASAHVPESMLRDMPMPSAMHVPATGPQPEATPTVSGAAAAPNGFGSEVDGVPGAYRVDQPGKNPLYTDNGQPMQAGYSTNALGSGGYSPGSAFTAGALNGPDGNVGTQTVGAAPAPAQSGPADTSFQAQSLRSKMLDMATNQAKYGGTAVVRQALAAMQPMLDQAEGNSAGSIAHLREGGDMARAQMQHQATMRGQDVSARGQDLELFGKQLSAKTSRDLALWEQANKNRNYQLEVSKFGEEQAKNRLAERETSDKSFDRFLEGTYVGSDQKPDLAMISTVKRGANAFLDSESRRAQQLAAQFPAGSPEQRRALAAADDIQQRGMSAIDPTRRQKLMKQLENQHLIESNHSVFNPIGTSYVHSDNPADYDVVGKQHNMLLPDEYVTRNGSRVQQRRLDIRQGGALPTGLGVPDTSFEPIKRGIRQ